MKSIKILLVALPITVLFVVLLAAKTLAQSTPANYDVTVSPIFFDLSANPGDTLTTKVRIRNNTTSPIPIKLGLQKLTGDLNGNLTLKQDKNDFSFSWIKFENDSIVTNPMEWTEVPFSISVPKEAAFGYYWAITFTQDVSSKYAKNGVSLTGAAAVPILLNVRKAGAKANAKITQFSVKNFINEYLPVDFTVKIENLGNIHVRPHGSIFIRAGNKDLDTLDVNGGLGSVIPNSARIFSTSWSNGFVVKEPVIQDGQPKLDKNGKPVEHLVFNWDKLTEFRIGHYTAHLLLVFDNGTRDVPLEGTLTFWVLPYKTIVGVVIFVIVAFFIIRWLLRVYINREVSKRLKVA